MSEAVLSLRNVERRYKSGTGELTVLNGVDLDIIDRKSVV